MIRRWSCAVAVWLLLASRATASPIWFPSGDDASYPRKTHVIGVGACGKEVDKSGRASCASQKALEQVASLIRAQVDVDRTRTTQAQITAKSGDKAQYTSTSLVTQNGRVRSSLELDSAEPVRAECSPAESTCYALVALERKATSLRWLRRHKNLQAEVASIFEHIDELDALRQVQSLGKARKLAEQQDELSELIASVGGGVPVPPTAVPKILSMASDRLTKLTLCMQARGAVDAEQLYARTSQDLEPLRLRRVDVGGQKGCTNAKLLLLAETSAAPERTVLGTMSVIDIRGTLSMTADNQVVASSVPLLGHGVAKTSELARDAAIEQLATSISKYVVQRFTDTK